MRAATQGVNEALVASPPSDTMIALERRREIRLAQQDEYAAQGGSFPLGARGEKWDSGAATKGYTLPADGNHFMWKDPDKPADQVGSYKLPFVSGDHAVWGAITAIAAALQGGRGGVNIPTGDVAGVKSKVASYYAKAAKQYKDDGIKVPWQAGHEAVIALATENGWEVYSIPDPAGPSEWPRGDWGTSDEHYPELVAAYQAAEIDALVYAQLGADADEALVAVARMEIEQQFAAYADCMNCDHAYSAHLGTAGPCTMADCNCTGYSAPETPDEDKPTPASHAVEPVLLAPIPDEVQLEAVVERVLTKLLTENGNRSVVTMTFDTITDTLPAPHAPGEVLPDRHPSPEAPASPAAGPPVEWSAILAPEGKLTSDGRALAPGSITWRNLPLTLMAMIETSEGGHIGAEIAGRIDNIWRDEAAGLIRGSGIFDDGEYGQMIARMVDDQTLRGVSVDLAISRYEMGPRDDWFDEDGNWAPKEHPGEGTDDGNLDAPSLIDLYSEETIAVILEAEIGMTTVCPFPAFEQAEIRMGDSLIAGANPAFWTLTHCGQFFTLRHGVTTAPLTAEEARPVPATPDEDCGCSEGLTASAAGLVPTQPPTDWFADPQLDEPTAITVTDEGRIYGHAAAWGVCHIGLPGACRTAPHSHTDYKWFHLGEVLTEDGGRVACGQITLDTGHADRSLGAQAATSHYDDTGTVVAHVACGEDEHGIWVAGALQPDAPEEKVRLLTGSKLSGDWRKIDGNLELVALLAVNVPGFPVPRAKALVASAEGEEPEVMTLVAAGIPVFSVELSEVDLQRFRALELHDDFTALIDQVD